MRRWLKALYTPNPLASTNQITVGTQRYQGAPFGTMGRTSTGAKAISEKAGPVKRKRSIQVVTAAPAFPLSTRKTDKRTQGIRLRQPQQLPQNSHKQDGKLLDWHDTVKEVRHLGATAFVGQQKRDFEAEQYKKLTGRDKKRQRVPLPIVRGIKKKAAQREAKAQEEARAAGITLPKLSKKERVKTDRSAPIRHGPTPSTGLVKKGILTVKRKPI